MKIFLLSILLLIFVTNASVPKLKPSSYSTISSTINHITSAFTSKQLPTKNKKKKIIMIGVAGGSASGKTTVSKMIKDALKKHEKVAVVCQDSFYRELTPEQRQLAKAKKYNFDHPKAFDNEFLLRVLTDLKNGKPAQIPHYDYVTSKRTKKTTKISGPNVIIVEGIFALNDLKIRKLMDIKLFVDTDADTRIIRRCLFFKFIYFFSKKRCTRKRLEF
jgi:pantothenate kinase